MEYVHLISDSGLDALRSVIGQEVYMLYTRAITVDRDHVTAPDFSLGLGQSSFCVIENDWADTPQTALDYYFLDATIRDWPKGVGRAKERNWMDALAHPSVVVLKTPAAAVVSVVVLEHRDSFDEESVHYDHGLVFTRSDGYRFALSAEHSIMGQLEFTDDAAEIDQLLAEYSERVRLC